jgi:hypothetical protein
VVVSLILHPAGPRPKTGPGPTHAVHAARNPLGLPGPVRALTPACDRAPSKAW